MILGIKSWRAELKSALEKAKICQNKWQTFNWWNAEQIKNSAVENFKANRASVLSKAEQDAELAYNDAVRKGREESLGKVEQARANLFKAADFIVEKVVK